MPAAAIERAPRAPRFDLLTAGAANPKTAKGDPLGFATAVLHLAPADLSGANVCRYSSPACVAGCLNRAGRGGIGGADNPIQQARIRRTRLLRENRRAFVDRVARDIARHVAWCARHGVRPAVRLNGTSDLPWENLRGTDGATLFERFPDVQFYDYTKAPIRFRRPPANYHLTFSLSESNDTDAVAALKAGVNVAAVFDATPGRGGSKPRKGAPLPATFLGRPVIDGDAHDLRFLDARADDGGPVVVGLRSKGTKVRRAEMAQSGFARPVA